MDNVLYNTVDLSMKAKDFAYMITTVGKIDRDKFKAIAENIVTDEVIITDERISHIKERHQGDYERYSKYMFSIIQDPDYIFEANLPDSAFLVKEFTEDGVRFELILKLQTNNKNPEHKNTVITFLKISEKTWRKYLRNKKAIYRKG